MLQLTTTVCVTRKRKAIHLEKKALPRLPTVKDAFSDNEEDDFSVHSEEPGED